MLFIQVCFFQDCVKSVPLFWIGGCLKMKGLGNRGENYLPFHFQPLSAKPSNGAFKSG